MTGTINTYLAMLLITIAGALATEIMLFAIRATEDYDARVAAYILSPSRVSP